MHFRPKTTFLVPLFCSLLKLLSFGIYVTFSKWKKLHKCQKIKSARSCAPNPCPRSRHYRLLVLCMHWMPLYAHIRLIDFFKLTWINILLPTASKNWPIDPRWSSRWSCACATATALGLACKLLAFWPWRPCLGPLLCAGGRLGLQRVRLRRNVEEQRVHLRRRWDVQVAMVLGHTFACREREREREAWDGAISLWLNINYIKL